MDDGLRVAASLRLSLKMDESLVSKSKYLCYDIEFLLDFNLYLFKEDIVKVMLSLLGGQKLDLVQKTNSLC